MAHRALMGLSKNISKQIINEYKPFQNLLVLDFEATCIKGQILKPQEIIEFPCLVISTEEWKVTNVFHKYVRPKVHPVISTFCTELTGIMEETVQDEQFFPEVFSAFCEWLEEGKYFSEKNKSAFVSCGDWDLKVMLPNQCQLDNIQIPEFMKEWINIKKTFFFATKYYPRSLNDMLKYLKMEFQGKEHCGLDDVHNISRVIQALDKKFKSEFTITSNLDSQLDFIKN